MNTLNFVSDLFYWPSIEWMVLAIQSKQVHLANANYSKGIHANLAYFLNANGKVSLSIPLVGGRSIRLPMQKVEISYEQDWQRQHLRSLQTMYGKAPFFENVFPYIDSFYQQSFQHLHDCNEACLAIITKLMGIDLHLENGQLPATTLPTKPLQYTYPQIFDAKIGFTPGLSVLDLIMNEGRNAKNILINIGSQIQFKQ